MDTEARNEGDSTVAQLPDDATMISIHSHVPSPSSGS